MKIGQNKVVELTYELEVDGEIVDRCPEERPLDYIHGTRTLLEKFEKNIEGMEPGDSFSFTLTPAEGYGEIDPERVIDLPKAAFEVNGEIREDLMVVGNRIPLINKNGGVVPGIILEVSENTVKIDLNSPMAGKTLNFSGKILTGEMPLTRSLPKACTGNMSRATADATEDAADMVRATAMVTAKAIATERDITKADAAADMVRVTAMVTVKAIVLRPS